MLSFVILFADPIAFASLSNGRACVGFQRSHPQASPGLYDCFRWLKARIDNNRSHAAAAVIVDAYVRTGDGIASRGEKDA